MTDGILRRSLGGSRRINKKSGTIYISYNMLNNYTRALQCAGFNKGQIICKDIIDSEVCNDDNVCVV